jgi:hypothetical protein
MNAGHLFLVCFAACTFSFVGVVIATWQIARAMTRRWLTSALPELIKAGMGAPDVGSAFTAGFNVTAPTAITLVCRQCHRLARCAPGIHPIGWAVDRVLGGWACRKCNGTSAQFDMRSYPNSTPSHLLVKCSKHDDVFSPEVGEYCDGCRKELVSEPDYTP